MNNNDVKLGSWKAIANFFERSERTVRRWETQEGMPVHRHKHSSASRIYALQSELEEWFHSRLEVTNKHARQQPNKAPTLAILPFEYFSEAGDKAFIPNAICEDIISSLTELKSIMVISFSSIRYLGQEQKQISDGLQRLNLDYYLEGSLRLEANEIRIQTRLVSAKDGQVSWTQKYLGPYEEWQKICPVIVADLIRSLPLANATKAFGNISEITLENLTAWEYLHQARFESMKWQPDAINRAIELLRAAEKLVGNNGLILASLGRTILQKREAGIDFSVQPIKEVEDILATLKKNEPDAHYTHMLTGWFHYANGKLFNAIESLRKAADIQPNDAGVLGLISNCYLLTGQPEMALPYIEILQIIDPLTPINQCLPGWYEIIKGNFAGAVKPYEQMLAMEPYNPVARLFMIWIYAINNNEAAVIQACEDYPPGQYASLPAVLAFAFRDGLTGNKGTFELSHDQVTMGAANEMFARFIAFAYAAHDKVDEAAKWLEKAFELGFTAYPFLKYHEPYLKPHHDNAQIEGLLERIRLEWERA